MFVLDKDKEKDVLDISFIGKRIRLERVRKKIKQNELAKKIGISNTYLSDIEHQRTIPSLITYIKICQALDVDLDFMLKQP